MFINIQGGKRWVYQLDHLTLPLAAGQKVSAPIPYMLTKLKLKIKINSGIIYISMLKHIGLDSPLKGLEETGAKSFPYPNQHWFLELRSHSKPSWLFLCKGKWNMSVERGTQKG